MYSAVLVLALTAGSDSVDFGRHGCNGGGYGGCSSYGYACSSFSGFGGCSSYGCSSSRGGLFGGHHGNRGCSGSGYACSSYVGYGCSSSGHGCSGRGGLFSGGLFGGHHGGRGCNGGGYGCSGSYGGGYGCSGSYGYGGGYGCSGSGCTGGVYGPGGTIIVPSTTPKDMPKGEKINDPKKTSIEGPATIVVNLPAEARLLVDGAATTSTSARRTLVTPSLLVGSTYVYNMTAEIVRDGRTVSQTQQVSVRGGQSVAVQFNFPTTQTVANSD